MEACLPRVYNGRVDTLPPLDPAARLYDLASTDLQPLRGGHVTHVFGFTREGRDYILRLSPPQAELDLAAQRAILAWVQFLAKRGACVPGPVPSAAGNLIENIPGEGGEWQAVVLTRARGVLSEELSLAQWDASLFEALGRAVGKLHAVAGEYDPTADLRRPEWYDGGNLFHCPEYPNAALMTKAAGSHERIVSLPAGPERYGLIHADLHFGNFYVDAPARIVTIFDFDDCCYGWYAMDLAILLFDVLVLYEGPDREAFARDFMGSLLQGYRQERSIGAVELGPVPEFIRLLELNLFCTISPRFAPGKDWWADRFMHDREEQIERNEPYIRLDFAGL